MVKWLSIAVLIFGSAIANAQTLGGNTEYNFLKAAATPQLAALGGINISQQTDDIGMAFQNPSHLRSAFHGQVLAVFQSYPGAIKNYNLLTAYHLPKAGTTLGLGITYFDYGSTQQTDPSGTLLGTFRPTDYVIQLMASRTYLTRWRYGVSVKFIHSAYGFYRSAAIGMDAGITYTDTAAKWQMALVLSNMGLPIKEYEGAGKGELPFDIRLGLSKKLANAPLQFSLTLHQLQHLNNRYSDSSLNDQNGNNVVAHGFFDGAFRHIVLSTQLYVGDKIEISAGYNYLRRKELNVGNAGNGLNGFSLGLGLLLKKWQLRYSRANYQNNIVNHQVGITFSFGSFSRNSQ